MHKYGVVYLTRGNELYVAKDMSNVTNFIAHKPVKLNAEILYNFIS